MGFLQKVWQVVRQASVDWREDNASRLAAALAYYAVFSLAPMAVLAVAVAGYLLGEGRAQDEVVSQVETWLQSEEAGNQVRGILENAREAGSTGTVVGIAGLVLGATVFFANLQDALNTVWEVKPKGGGFVPGFLKKRAVSFLMVLGLGAMLASLFVLSTLLTAVGRYFEELLPMPPGWLQLGNALVSFVLITLLFGVVYRVLPDARIAWRDVWTGAVITSLLFVLGAAALGVYFAFTSVGSAYGAAGSLIVIIVWVYWSAQVFLFGAEVTQVYANRFGRSIRPEKGAEYRPGAHRSRELRAHRDVSRGQEGEVLGPGVNFDPARSKSPWPFRPKSVRPEKSPRSRPARVRNALLYLALGAGIWEAVRRRIRP